MSKDYDIEVDNDFFIPEGLEVDREEALDEEDNDLYFNDGSGGTGTEGDDGDDDFDGDSGGDEDEPEAPLGIEIVSQTLRTLPDGTQVVDVVVELEDFDGVTDYNVRKVKVG